MKNYIFIPKYTTKLNNIDIVDNLKEGRIGIYLNELIPNIKITMNLNF